MSCPTFSKNAVAFINCAHEDCDIEISVPLVGKWDYKLGPPKGFMRIDIDAYFGPCYFEKRRFFFCEEHARKLLPGFFEYFHDDKEADPD